jgi:hypothetical protein
MRSTNQSSSRQMPKVSVSKPIALRSIANTGTDDKQWEEF